MCDSPLRLARLICSAEKKLTIAELSQTLPALHITHVINDARQLPREIARSMKDLGGVFSSTQIVRDDPFAGIVKAVAKANPEISGSAKRMIAEASKRAEWKRDMERREVQP